MTPKEEIKKEIRYIEKLEFNGVANYEHTNAIKKALNYYLDMNGATKEEIRAERDMEIIENLSYVDNDSWGEAMGVKKVLDWIKENK